MLGSLLSVGALVVVFGGMMGGVVRDVLNRFVHYDKVIVGPESYHLASLAVSTIQGNLKFALGIVPRSGPLFRPMSTASVT